MKSVVALSLLVFFCVLPKNTQQTFWRLPVASTVPPTTLPADSNAPIYQKLQTIPPPQKTVQSVLENFFDFQPAGKRGKRSVVLEDIVFVMDGSGSVPECEFRQGLQAFKQAIEMCQTPRSGKTFSCRHAAVTFSTLARIDFPFLSSAQANRRLGLISYPGGSTNTQAGLKLAKSLFKTGSRRFSKLKVMLITDGHSNVDEAQTIPMARELKQMGVHIAVVAVGTQDTDAIKEMAHVASSPPEKNIFRVHSVGEIVYIFELVLEKLQTGHFTPKPYKSPC